MGSSAAAAREIAWALSPWAPSPRPHRTSDVDTAFLTSVFAARDPAVRAEDVVELDGTSGTTDRRRVEVRWNRDGSELGLPSTLFLKGTSPSAKNRAMVGALSMARHEVLFYERAAPSLGDVCPAFHGGHSGHGARHLLVLEDIAADGGTTFALADDCPIDHAHGIVLALARLHAAFESSPRLRTDLAFAKPMTRRAGATILRHTMRRVRSTFLARQDEHPIGPHARRMLELVQAHDKQLYAAWETGPQTLLHGDSHLGNTFRRADGRSGLLDWQVVFSGPGIREVTYFIAGGLPVELRRSHELELLRCYLEVLAAEGGTAPSFDDAFTAYRAYLFDAWDSASICVLWPGLQTPGNVAASVARANAAVEDLEADEAIRTLV
jgi:hypothetical protein